MIPRAARRPGRAETAGVLRVAPGYVNRRTDDERPEPFLVLVPILLIIIPDLVRKMFRRVALLAREIDDRTEHGLYPLEESHIPAEVRPFVAAINRLLARVARSMEAQRRFVADAAHELRTPLTALSLQAELVSEAEMSDAGSDDDEGQEEAEEQL